MLQNLSSFIKKIAGAIDEDTSGTKYHVEDIKIVFSAPEPDKASPENLTKEPEKSMEANFQWMNYLVLFSVVKGNETKFYIFKMPLNSDGTERGPNKIFESDSKWSPKNVKLGIISTDIDPGKIKTQFPELLKDLNLFPKQKVNYISVEDEKLPQQFKKPAIPQKIQQAVPGLKSANDFDFRYAKTYSSEEFKGIFDNNYYIVMNTEGPEKKNPFGKLVKLEGK